MNPPLAFIVLLIVLTTLCDTVAQLCLKASINLTAGRVDSIKAVFELIGKLAFVPLVWIALLSSAISLCLWIFVLSKADLSLAFSIDSLHYVLIAAASQIFLKERVEAKRWGGIVLIMAGVALVTLTAK